MFNTTSTISESFILCHLNEIVTHLCAKSDAEYWRYQMVLSTWGECAGSWPCVWPWPGSSATSASGRDPSQLARWDTVMHVYFCVCLCVCVCVCVCVRLNCKCHMEALHDVFTRWTWENWICGGGICIWICERRNLCYFLLSLLCFIHWSSFNFHLTHCHKLKQFPSCPQNSSLTRSHMNIPPANIGQKGCLHHPLLPFLPSSFPF